MVKTIRLTKELEDYLVEEAKKSNITVSALASQIFTSYRDRYSFVDKLNPVAMTPANMALLLECIDDSDMIRLAPIIASKVVLYNKHILGVEKSGKALDWCISELLPAAHWFNCYRSKEGYMITHQMGGKWSIFLTSFLPTLVEEESGAKPSLKVDGDIIILTLPGLTQNKKASN